MELAREAANKAVEDKTKENKKLVKKMKGIVRFSNKKKYIKNVSTSLKKKQRRDKLKRQKL